MSGIETLKCPVHDIDVLVISQGRADELGVEHGCRAHNAELRARPPVDEMTIAERVAELWSMDGPLYHGMDLLWSRMDALVGRPLFTHERADFDVLEHEIRTGSTPSMEGIVAKFPHDKPVVGVLPGDET